MKPRHILALFITIVLFLPAASAATINTDLSIIKTEPVPLETGEYATVWLNVRNTGDTTAKDLTVDYEATYPFAVDPDEKISWEFASLAPGEERHIRLQVRIDENAIHGNNTVRFRTQTGTGPGITKKLPVEVRTDDAALIVEDVVFPSAVSPGMTREMTLRLRNLADSHLKNIDVTLDLSADSLPFTVSGTTQQRVQSVAPGNTTNVTYAISTDEDAENGAYKIPLSLEYEDETGTDHSREMLTGIVVGGQPWLEVGINGQELRQRGTTGTVTLRIVNRGDGTARFTQLNIPSQESYELLSPNTIYLGNMQPDDYQTAELELYADTSHVKIPVELSYRDGSGNGTVIQRTVSMKLYSDDDLRRFNLASGTSPLTYIVPLIVLAAVAGWYWRRRKRRA